MRKLRRLRERLGWGDGHFTHLATGHDFFNDAWGRLDLLTPDELAATVRDMKECWRAHADDVAAQCRPNEPWFSRYAYNLQTLIDEVTAQREHRRRYPHGDKCRCPRCTA